MNTQALRTLSVRLLGSWVLPILTGILLVISLPPFDYFQAAWVGLIPLLAALHGCGRGEAFRRGYLAGLVFFGGTVWWTIHVTAIGTVGLVAFLALYFGLAAVYLAWLLSRIPRRAPATAPAGSSLLGVDRQEEPCRQPSISGRFGGARPGEEKPVDSVGRNLAVVVLATAGWVALEWIRGKFLFGGFPWNFLGVSQHENIPIIQIASWTGVYGLSAMVCFTNVAFYMTFLRFVRHTRYSVPLRRLSWEFHAAILLICGSFLYGVGRVRSPATAVPLQLALVQGNIPQSLKFDPAERPMILDRYRRLTETVLVGRPDLIIWPETATPDALRYDRESLNLVTDLAGEGQAWLLTGTVDYTPYSSPPVAFNAAGLVRPDGRLDEIYHKTQLVPFGEYVPLRKILPFMRWLTPIPDSFERGHEYTVFQIGDGERVPELSFGAVICFEDTVGDLYRRFVLRGVDFMVNLTNDAWFKQSPAGAMHLANAVFRTVENRRPLVRATNNGVTCIVDQFGAVRNRLDPFVDGTLSAELLVPAREELTFYTRHGDVFVVGCALVTLIGLATGAWRERRRPE